MTGKWENQGKSVSYPNTKGRTMYQKAGNCQKQYNQAMDNGGFICCSKTS